MHSTFESSETAPAARPFWLRAAMSFGLMATFAIILGLWAPAARAQVFLAEVADNDIGRIGPTGLALDVVAGVQYLYVSDQNHGRIIKYNLATGARVAVWGTTGNANLQFNSPYGIAIDPVTHDLFIAERGNHRIQRITNQGAFVMTWGIKGTANGEFDAPLGVAVDAAGNVYVTDHNNNRIQKFHFSGATVSHVATWGGAGFSPGQLNGPYGITLDAQGNLWVADAFNHRVQKFDVNGNLLAVVGTFGSGDGQFNTPTWVSFDSTGSYYVCETNSNPQDGALSDIQNQRIQKFTAAGTFVTKWGSYGEAGGQFRLPFNIVVDATGTGWVADYYNTRLQKFNMNAVPTAVAPTINSSTSASGAVGQFFLYNTTAAAIPAVTTYSAVGLPTGLTINPTSGAISGNATVGGNFSVTINATNAVGTASKVLSLALTGASGAPVITSATSVNATVGSTFSYAITATNTPTSYGAQGLPPGLTLNSTTGVITGVPASAGPFTTVVTASNASGTGQVTVALTVANDTGAAGGMQSKTVAVGGTATFSAQAGGTNTYQWMYNGNSIAGATGATYTVSNAQPINTGIYTVVVNGTIYQSGILGVTTTQKVVGTASVAGSDIVHPNGNVYDQLLMTGAAATFTADPGQVTRCSFIDLNDDIVQVEFSGAGSVSIILDNASGPAPAVKYNQPTVAYMKGHATITIAGADASSNVSVFSVGKANAANPALFPTGMTYDAMADVAVVAVASATGQFGGLHTANCSFWHTRGKTGIFAPGVQILRELYVGDIDARTTATPVIMIGSAQLTQVNGGNVAQTNGANVEVSGLTKLYFVAGTKSDGFVQPATPCAARLLENGVDITDRVVVNPQ
jgi:hypothetical protein